MPTLGVRSQPQAGWLVPAFNAVLTRAVVQAVLREQGVVLYWRALTPLVTLWGLVYQRLLGRGTLADVVAALQAGAADGLDAADAHAAPLSERLRSVSTSAYHQARQRLPTGAIRALRERLTEEVERRLDARDATQRTWRGRRVRLLDGTTLRLPPEGDLEATYGRAGGRYGPAHWVTAQAVISVCPATQLVVAHAESAHAPSETALVRAVLAGEPAGTLAVGDMAFGIYRVAQVAYHAGHDLLVRLDPRHVPGLLGRPKGAARPRVPSGTTWAITWAHRAGIAHDAELPRTAVPGRVLFVRVETPGFRPLELYLFTTLPAEEAPADELVALYAGRWQVELRYRELKATLAMEYFDVRTAAMFEKELEVGLLTHTLIRAAQLDAAPDAARAGRLSFAAGRRWLREAWRRPGPALARPAPHERERLAAGRLAERPRTVAHEPRAVRRAPQPYPALKTSREEARRANLQAIGAISS